MRWSMRTVEGVGRDFNDVKHRRTSGDRAYHVVIWSLNLLKCNFSGPSP